MKVYLVLHHTGCRSLYPDVFSSLSRIEEYLNLEIQEHQQIAREDGGEVPEPEWGEPEVISGRIKYLQIAENEYEVYELEME